MESLKRRIASKSVQTEDLIQLVRDRRCLWDRSHPSYRDRQYKENAWLDIYREVEPSYDKFSEEIKNLIGLQITRKWYNVRDSYVKSRKTQSIRHKPYLHSKLLEFLEPIYFEKGFEDGRSEEKSDNDEEWLSEVLLVDDEGNGEPDAKIPKLEYQNKSKEDSQIETEESIVNVLASLINKEDDDDRAFFRSIMPTVKRLTEESKFELRIQIMNILKDLMAKERNAVNMKHGMKREETNDSDTD